MINSPTILAERLATPFTPMLHYVPHTEEML